MYRTPTTSHVVRALTVAGSDSGGGAGVQADLKTMHQFGVYGMSVITALTAQNTTGVQGIHEVPPEFVAAQLESVLSDLGVDALKTGMLANASIIDIVASTCKDHGLDNLVVDPVMVAKGGSALLADSAVESLTTKLLPLASVVTPNIPEAELLCGFGLQTWDDYHRAAQVLAQTGARCVIIKGGHMEDRQNLFEEIPGLKQVDVAIDIVWWKGAFTYFVTPRIQSAKTHGTGCTFSSAITSMLAKDVPMLDAISVAKSFIYEAIQSAADWDVGSGHGPTDHSAPVAKPTAIELGGVYFLEDQTWRRIN